MKVLITAVALATLITAPAFAQTQGDPSGQYGRASAPVMKGGQAIGHDPDPWIRNEILRHSNSGWPD
jgi:hypothetical protein